LLAVAALLRFRDLAGRGTWDSDQGHDMLTWLGLIRDGTIPLLGPPTSIGDFHHGALYYYLVAPAAAIGGGETPVSVLAGIALAGTAAVAVTWWLARAIGGPVPAFVGGLLLAVSAAAVEGSTFIWNPNLIAFSAALTLACAWRARHGGGPWWWLAAAAGAAMTMQCHVLGVILLPGVIAFWLADVRSKPAGPARRAVLRAGAAGAAIIVVSYVPLYASELTTSFSETRAALDFLRSGGGDRGIDPLTALIVVAVRTMAWPLVGLFIDILGLAIAAAALVAASAVGRSWRSGQPERSGARWLGATLAWSILALWIGAASLTTVVRALPVDHYHAFVDPIVIVLTALGIAAAYRRNVIGRVAAVLVTGFLVAWNLAIAPPATSPDGGYPAAQAAAARVLAVVGGRPLALVGLPEFKPTDSLAYPLTIQGARIVEGSSAPLPGEAFIVVLCDDRFHEAIGARCGGPAESRVVAGGTLVDQFEAHPSRWVSVFAPSVIATAGERSLPASR
jgi:4-amino-4-deoxy-L-arabinose transferase-like glycosyltransferase